MTHRFRTSGPLGVNRLLFVTVMLFISNAALAQTTRTAPTAAKDDGPVFHEYRGIQIGWLADDVRKKLGNPANKGETEDYYVFGNGDNERCQILYDKATQKVTTISVDFMNGATDVITPQQVFGADVETKPDGSKHKLVRYPKAGFWVSYSRTAGDTPIVSVTLQKMP
ncbi:MAG TPA: hypothetical protein VJP89_24115 [Pyrinomonadaceae bacterium]|nr:hypothetical protein [Pyrinomonadaceae bacterium]